MLSFFATYVKIRTAFGIKPGFIFNADETMVRLGENQTKVAVSGDEPPSIRLDPGSTE